MKRIGLRLTAKIVENTLNGISADGKPLKPYSTKPFSMPYGAVKPKSALTVLIKNNQAFVFMKKNHKHWVVIKGGYLELRKAMGRSASVNMSVTGSMLRAMRPINISADTITIGFNRAEEAQKAYWHTQSGAGKSKVIRDFLGLPDKEIEATALDEINSEDLVIT